ncbi:MAG: PhoH family protein [Clostridiaceae bacterium]|nr:PhoH family protein [Clostridiaceae bacterium]
MEKVVERQLELPEPDLALNLFGANDKNIRIIEDRLDVKITARYDELHIRGFEKKADIAVDIIKKLMTIIQGGELITEQNIRYLLDMTEEERQSFRNIPMDQICVTYRGRPIKIKTFGQKKYVDAMRDNPIVFGIGPAGTGKTFLAVAMAVKAFREKMINRIILTRPAVEAGERLGFLPGDLQNKVDPYLRPLYDALYQIMGPETYHTNLEKGIIEVAPLAYMRGRTLDDSFIILDEAQNTTAEQMKMFLTRMGIGSRMVITGDITQIDLPGGKSGLVEARRILRNIEGISMVHLTHKDVVRHELVQRIIKAYEKETKGGVNDGKKE